MVYGLATTMKTAEVFAKTAALVGPKSPAMKVWLNEFLQNAAFPAVVLAFACTTINNRIPDHQASRLIDRREAAKITNSPLFNQAGNQTGVGAHSSLQTGPSAAKNRLWRGLNTPAQ
jgi:hypothetical protein